jgi:glycosyltransferase involved in cell wall biosynthesis
VIVPSEFSADHYRQTLGLECTVLPCPFDWHRVSCHASPEERYVTFVNPEPHKGVSVFARIAEQLHLLRPDISLLVVEGRSGMEWLQRMPLDLSHVTNLNVMKNTPDPRDFLRVSHLLLMPSLCEETFGRVAAEAMINGIPVLASRRGALPEILGNAGFLFEIPGQYTASNCDIPSSQDVAPWVKTICRLWDDSSQYRQASRRARDHADMWRPDAILKRYKHVFEDTIGTGR